jgi:excisionase family DNA binding protein
MDSDWMSTTQATRILGVTAATLYRMINDGQIRAYRFGRVIRIKAADLDAYIKSERPARRRDDPTSDRSH